MSSRDSEPRRSMGPPAASSKTSGDVSSKQRGPNPQTDYKRHFNRTKERFDVVTSVSDGNDVPGVEQEADYTVMHCRSRHGRRQS